MVAIRRFMIGIIDQEVSKMVWRSHSKTLQDVLNTDLKIETTNGRLRWFRPVRSCDRRYNPAAYG